MPKVSVIIPVYNTEKYLRECLDSIVNQTLKDIEIICIDDCSTDNSLSILEEYAKKDNRFIIIKNTQNQGTGKNRNIAIDMCSGEYIMFLDSDDWFELNACELAYNCIKENDNDIVLFDNYLYFNHKNQTKCQNRLKPFEIIKNKINIDLKKEFVPYLFSYRAPWNSIYKTPFIKNNHVYFSETVSTEDLPFTVKARILADKISLIEEPLVYFRKVRKTIPERCINRWEEFYNNIELSYQIIIENTKCQHFLDSFFISLLNEYLYRYDFATNYCKQPKEIVFNKTKNILLKWGSEYDISHIKEHIDMKKYNRFLKSENYKEYEFYENCLSKIFSIRKVHNHIYISLLYLKFKIKIN